MGRALLSVLVIGMATTLAFAQQLQLAWTDNTNGQAETIVQRGPAMGGPFVTIAQLPMGVTAYQDSTISYGTTYCYRVAATNSSGTSAYSNVACADTGVPAAYALSVTKQGPGTVTSSPGGISCGATCSATYGAGQQVRLTATPNNGARFYGWSGGCSGTALACTLTISGPTSVLATFTRKK
ncbi:MAG TPA: hypothetical protein VL563_15860 [Gemmatimonadales bacterium]|nr:hypothetical protein [Gemmatimonadales bacterium]